VRLGARGDLVEGRDALIEGALGRGADDHDLALELGVLLPVHDVGDGEVLERLILAQVVDGHQPAAVHRGPDLASEIDGFEQRASSGVWVSGITSRGSSPSAMAASAVSSEGK